MWKDLPTPVVIAHRGDRAYAPENTLSAFKQAVRKGADAIEFDVKLTADGKVIVLHDQTVDRTTNGTGDAGTQSLGELQNFDAGIQFPGLYPNEKIPTLEEVFETVGGHIYMNIELTNYSTPNDALVSKVADLIKKHRLQNRILFSSFIPKNLHLARAFLPEVLRGLLTLKGFMGLWGRSFGWRGDFAALNPYFTDLSVKLVTRVHSAGKQINAWTVNAEEDIKRVIDLGVDGIITDDPALALRLVGREK